MHLDVDRYIRNCHACRRAYMPQDKILGMLYLLLVLEYLWQHLTIDFKSMLEDKASYDTVFVVIDRLSKQAISIPCYKTTIAEQMAQLYITYVYYYYGPPESIVSDRGPQFISQFWAEFNCILGTKIKLSIVGYAQTDGQTEIMN